MNVENTRSEYLVKRLNLMQPVAESEAKVVYKEPPFVDEHHFVVTAFIREAPIEENTSSEYIRTVAATCGCNILMYEYEANCERYPKNTS